MIKLSLISNNCVLVPLVEPLRVTIWYEVVGVKGYLLNLSKPKSEALGVLGKMEKSLDTH